MNLLENIASPEKFFYCADGSVLRSIRELGQKLETISSQAFSSHVNSQKNDFHNWVRDVFQDNELAGELLKAKTQQQAAAAVRKRMQKLLQAKEEIESAISKMIEKPVMLAAANKKRKLGGTHAAKAKNGIAKTKAQNSKRKKTAKAENRKVNKKKRKEQAGKKRHRMRNNRKSRNSAKTKPKLRQLKAHVKNKMKKQVSNWLKWLSISPKM